MKNEEEPSLSELAARVLRTAEHHGSPGDSDDRREQHLALLAGAMRDQRARASRRRWSAGALAAAAIVVAAVGVRTIMKAPPSIAHAPPGTAASVASFDVHVEGAGAEIVHATPPSSGAAQSVRAGDRVTATASSVALVVATGTKVTLNPGADVSVVEEGRTQAFGLRAGIVRAEVAKLHEGERFVVRTSDTEVEVRGTSFSVERVESAPPCRPELHTRVVVSEGVVVVRHAGAEDHVRAGEEWPPPCPAPAVATATSAAAVASTSATAAPAVPVSKLAAANDLFAKAQAARRAGDHRGAVALFDRLLAEHPTSPNVEAATVERMRELDQFDRGRAVSAAREYLARFPRGFARAEAESIIALSP